MQQQNGMHDHSICDGNAIPINAVIHSVTSLDTLHAHVPVVGAVVLVLISMILTLIAGLIPSGVAARKDPVEALRTE